MPLKSNTKKPQSEVSLCSQIWTGITFNSQLKSQPLSRKSSQNKMKTLYAGINLSQKSKIKLWPQQLSRNHDQTEDTAAESPQVGGRAKATRTPAATQSWDYLCNGFWELLPRWGLRADPEHEHHHGTTISARTNESQKLLHRGDTNPPATWLCQDYTVTSPLPTQSLLLFLPKILLYPPSKAQALRLSAVREVCGAEEHRFPLY